MFTSSQESEQRCWFQHWFMIMENFRCSSCENGRHDMCQGKTGAGPCDCEVCADEVDMNG